MCRPPNPSVPQGILGVKMRLSMCRMDGRRTLSRRTEPRMADSPFPCTGRVHESVRSNFTHCSLAQYASPECARSRGCGVSPGDTRHTNLCFKHGVWSTQPIRPVVGLRQDCSLPPMTCRSELSVVVETLRRARGLGRGIAECRLLCLALADDTRLAMNSPAEVR